MADQNHFPGIDMVRFGENISIIQKRVTFENRSILEVYEKAIEIFRDYYQYEEIKGADRKKIEKIPEAAFREAIANGLIHRIWDVESQIRVLMFENRIEVVSPGGLPAGITKDEYLSGKLAQHHQNRQAHAPAAQLDQHHNTDGTDNDVDGLELGGQLNDGKCVDGKIEEAASAQNHQEPVIPGHMVHPGSALSGGIHQIADDDDKAQSTSEKMLIIAIMP